MTTLRSTVRVLTGLLFLLAAAAWAVPPESVEIMPVDQIKPGMRGAGRTVFAGEQLESFEFEVVDVLRNYHPGQDVVLVRLLGPRVEQIGVAAGMSGSPVYIDGKLLGAIAYRFGTFSKEPLAGVMPIEQMLPVLQQQEKRATLWKADRHLSDRYLSLYVDNHRDERAFLPPATREETAPAGLQPWPQLLVLSGFRSEVVDWARVPLLNRGYVIAAGGASEGSSLDRGSPSDLEPGSPVALVLVDGDASIEAVGTVTWRQGNKVLAFGHPVFDAGPISFPMGRVRIATTIPSLYASEKMPVLLDLIGTFHQDRLTGALGEIGPLPKLTVVKVRCRGADAAPREFRFRAALDPSLRTMVPFYLRVALINAIESSRMSGGDYSLRVRSRLYLNGRREIVLDNFYARRETAGFLSPMEDVLRSTMDVASVVATLMFNPFQPVEFDSLLLDVEILPRSREAQVMQLWCDRSTVEPGDSLTVIATLLSNDGRWHTIRRSYKLPQSLPEKGRLTVTVAGADEMTQTERRLFPHRYRPSSFDQLVQILSSKRRNDRLYIQISAPDAGLAVGVKELPSLPPSLLAVFGNQRTSGELQNLRTKVIVEDAVPLGYEIAGSRSTYLTLEHKNER